MKTWQIYTLMGFVGCMVSLQAWNTYILSQHKAEKTSTRSVDNKKRKVTYREYCWKSIPKSELSEQKALKEALDIARSGKLDFTTAMDNLHSFLSEFMHDEEYVGTLCVTEDSVIIITKKNETKYFNPNDPDYIDPDDPFGTSSPEKKQ